jgi:hypothetical protein
VIPFHFPVGLGVVRGGYDVPDPYQPFPGRASPRYSLNCRER